MNQYLQKFNIFLFIIILCNTQVFCGTEDALKIFHDYLESIDKELKIEIPNSYENQEYPCPITIKAIVDGINIFASLFSTKFFEDKKVTIPLDFKTSLTSKIQPIQLSWNRILNKLSYANNNQKTKDNLTKEIKFFGTFIVWSSCKILMNILYNQGTKVNLTLSDTISDTIKQLHIDFLESKDKKNLNKEFLRQIYIAITKSDYLQSYKLNTNNKCYKIEKTINKIDDLFSIEINLSNSNQKLFDNNSIKKEGFFTCGNILIITVFFGVFIAFGLNKYLNRKKSA